MRTYAFAAQYWQNLIPPEGSLIRWDWFRRFRSRPGRSPNDQIVHSWDTASKAAEGNGWSACTTWLIWGKDCHLLDVLRARLEVPRAQAPHPRPR